ncbi:2-iminobutanoate/2-iminopropanoate deaminase [Pedobacter sp. W3I1]|uniref:RidA family protein n=1 Tax=Pedobacter sp. W3I1 TaxID=3042291 RepID=UPI002788F772|nr:RidA family protein [Pedobacter sp. W3I1]MDQ0641116.1 2-iminobutanoate/2-iminopropanoate deaminase [Pedobacter sp. W3I1]
MNRIVLWLFLMVSVCSCKPYAGIIRYALSEENVLYSKAVIANGFLYSSGQLGINPKTKLLQPDLESQTRQIMDNLRILLEQHHSDMEHLVKINIYLKDISQLRQVNEIYTSYLSERKPARTSVQINALPQDALIEIDCIALVQ